MKKIIGIVLLIILIFSGGYYLGFRHGYDHEFVHKAFVEGLEEGRTEQSRMEQPSVHNLMDKLPSLDTSIKQKDTPR